MMAYFPLVLTGALPVAASAGFYLLDKKGAFRGLSNWTKQLIYGLAFGILSVIGSEFGVPVDGVIMNVRDAAPLCAGLIFGAPAGIMAGCIGGAERWLSVYWGGGTVTRLACSLSTCMAGLFAAALRKWMFDDKKPTCFYGMAAGIIMEVFHMLMIFFTNNEDVRLAFALVKKCSLPMIICNALSACLAVLVVSLLGRERMHLAKEHRQLTQTFSRWLLLMVLVAFAFTSVCTYFLQTSFAGRDNSDLLSLNLADVKADIGDASDANLLELTRRVAERLDREGKGKVDSDLLKRVQVESETDVSEINLVNRRGIITASTEDELIGFDMSTGWQSAAFLVLLEGDRELVQRYAPRSFDGVAGMKYAAVLLDWGEFVQVGYNAERFHRDIDIHVVGATRNRHVGENGYMVICSEDGTIVSAPQGYKGKRLDAVGFQIDLGSAGAEEGERFQATVLGQPCYCMYAVTEGYYIIAVTPVEEVLFSRDLSVCLTVFMEVLIFAALFILVYILTKRLVVDNIHEINRSLREITGGNLNVSVNVRTNEEFVSLSDDINSTVLTLKGYIAEAAERIDKELEVAKVIQSSTLPSVFPPYPQRTDFDIFASMDTAKEVGGDFYDFYLLDEGRLAFLVADVSGKGITAAMFMMKAKTLLKSCAEQERDVAEILTQANAALCEGNEAEMFVTCWMGILDLSTHIVTFANAGHNPPLVRHKDGSFSYFRTRPGLVLAGMEGVRYRSGELELKPGDEIFLYTDGVTEATDANNELYGEDRLLAVIDGLRSASAEALCRAVKADVDAFVGEAPQFDDMTMLCLRLLPRNALALTPDEASIAKVDAFVEESLEAGDAPAAVEAKLHIAVDEIFSNIVRYSGADWAEVECAVAPGRVKLVFTDNGRPYDPTTQAPEPDVTASAEDRDIGGLGLLMVKKMMDQVSYSYQGERNILVLLKTW